MPASLLVPPPSITAGEQRLLCVVMSAPAIEPDAATAPTIAVQDAGDVVDRLRAGEGVTTVGEVVEALRRNEVEVLLLTDDALAERRMYAGPAPTQIGLDADVWLTEMPERKLSSGLINLVR